MALIMKRRLVSMVTVAVVVAAMFAASAETALADDSGVDFGGRLSCAETEGGDDGCR